MMRIHHIGYLVKDIVKAKDEFYRLGYEGDEVIRDQIRGIDICFLEKDGYCVELVSPYCPESAVSGLLKRYKNTPYHICYISSDINEDIQAMTTQGYVQIGEPEAAPAIDGRRVVFLMNANIGMIELVEEE